MDKSRSNRLSNVAKKRRSSILKSHRPPRTPFSDLEFNIATPGDRSRRVSFSRRTDVAEFVTHEATTTWKNIYVEHNKSDSLGNESDAHAKGSAVIVSQNVRIFENQFQEIETDCVNTIGNPKSLIHINSSYNDINLTNQITLQQSIDEVKIKAPTQNFELSYFTEKASKVFSSESTNPNFGETSGRINIDFSDIQTIVTDRPVKDDLDEITDDLGRVDNNLLGGPFRGRNVSQYIEVDLDMTHKPNEQSDMSITDTITDPKVQEVSKSISYQDAKRNSTFNKDWVNDKENIIVNPYAPCEIDNFEKKEEKVLVFDGKKLKYASIDADLNDLVDPTVNKSKSKGNSSNMLIVDYNTQHSTSTNIESVVTDTHSSSSNVSTMRNDQVANVNETNIENITPTIIKNDNIVPIQQFRDEIHHRKTIEVNMHDDLPNFGSEIQLVQNFSTKHTEGQIQSTLDISDYTEPLKNNIFDADMSVTKGVISGFEPLPKRTTIHFENDDKMGDISVTQGVIGVMNTNTEKRKTILFEPTDIGANISMTQALPGTINLNKDLLVNTSTNLDVIFPNEEINQVSKKHTILFDQEDNNADISMTQCIINKSRTETYGRKSIYANQDMSVTEAVIHKISNNDILPEIGIVNTLPSHVEDVTKKPSNQLPLLQRKTIILNVDDDLPNFVSDETPNDNCNTTRQYTASEKLVLSCNIDTSKSKIFDSDMSVTKALLGRIEPRRTTIHFDNNDAMADISMTQAVKGVINTHNSEKRKTILFNSSDIGADISMTQVLPTAITINNDLLTTDAVAKKLFIDDEYSLKTFQDPHKNLVDCDYSIQNTRNTINYENISNIPIYQTSIDKTENGSIRNTIHFNNDDSMADISVTKPIIGLIESKETEKICTIIESRNIGPDISMAEIKLACNTTIVDIGSQLKRNTINFNKNDPMADIFVTKPIIGLNEANETETRRTHIFNSSNIVADMSMTQTKNITETIIDTTDSRLKRNWDESDKMADVSMTDPVIELIEPKETEKRQTVKAVTNIAIDKTEIELKRNTINFVEDDKMADISVTNPINGLIEPNEIKKRQTLIFESGNIESDMSMTQAKAVNKPIIDKTENTLRRNTINFNKDDTLANVSITKPIIGLIDLKETVKIQTPKIYILENCNIGSGNSMAEGKLASNTTIVETGSQLKRNTTNFNKDDTMADIFATKSIIGLNEANETKASRTHIFNSSNIVTDMSMTQTRNWDESDKMADVSMTDPVIELIDPKETEKRQTVILESSYIGPNTSMAALASLTKTTIVKTENGLKRNTIVNIDKNDADMPVAKSINKLIDPMELKTRKTIIFQPSDFGPDNLITKDLPVITDIHNSFRKSLNNTKNINDYVNECRQSTDHLNETNIHNVINESMLDKNDTSTGRNEINTNIFNHSENIYLSISKCETNVQNIDTNSTQINKLPNSPLNKEDSQSFLSDSFIEKVDNSLTTDLKPELLKATQDLIKKTEINKSLLLSDFHKINPYDTETLVLNVNESLPNKFYQEDNLQFSQNVDNKKQLQEDGTNSNINCDGSDLLQDECVDISMTEIKDKIETKNTELFNATDNDADVSMTQAVEPRFSAHNQDTTTMLNNISLAQAILRKSGIDFDNIVDDSIEPSQEEIPQPCKISLRNSNDVARTLQFDEAVDESEQFVTDADFKMTPLKKSAVVETSVIKDINKSIVIPSYVTHADDIKELMEDLVKPMADVPYQIDSEDIKSVDTNIQANLNTSSQIDMDIGIIKIKSGTKTISPKHTKKENRRHTTIVSSKKVLTFDHKNPLNNVSLPSLGNIEAHKYNPISIENINIIDNKPIDNVLLESVKENIIVIDDETELKIIKESIDYSNENKNINIKETEVNTVIIMKNNKELLAETSLTVIDDELIDSIKKTKTDKCIKTDEFEEQLEVSQISRKRIYSPTKHGPSEYIKIDITPKPQNKILRKSNSPLNPVKSPEKTLTTCIHNEKVVKFNEDNELLESKNIKKVNQSITTELIKECYGVNKMDDKSKNIVMGSLRKEQNESKSQTEKIILVKEEEEICEKDVSMIEDGKKSVQEINCDYYMPQDSELIYTVKKMPFMGSKMCEWESETPSVWCFLLFHSRLRLTISFHKSNTQVTDDTFVQDINLDIVKEDENPVAYQCIQVAYRCINHHMKVLGLVSASEIPGLLKRVVVTLYQTRRWGQVMEDCRLRLAYTFTTDGYIMLKVANTHLRTVWEVTIQTDVTSHPIARAIGVKCLLTKQDVREGEVGKVVGKVPEDWGHVPNTLWKIFRHLKNKTKSDIYLLGF